jgi:pimeloyl-ACP methyl ester carboxylesterase
MARSILVGLCAVVVFVDAATPQVPAEINGHLLFTLGGALAGSESYRLERLPGGALRLTGEVDLQVPTLHIVQSVEVEGDRRLAFRAARVLAVVNDDTTDVVLTRENGFGVQNLTQGDSTVTARVATPEGSVLLTNNVIHHVVQFTWLFDGGVGATQDFVAFPQVPVTVALQESDSIVRDGQALAFRRFYLNIANRLGAYVWLADNGTALKVSVPLQAFEAVSEAHQEWAPLLNLEPRAPGKETSKEYEEFDARFESEGLTLAGTLTLPRGTGPFPAAVLISGSGPQDRDENTPGPGGLKLGIFRAIADTLTRRGVAVLRYDDRGVGGSGGSLSTAGLSDLVADVRAAVRYLRARPEIDDSRIALIGHSEGGIIAPIVAAEDPTLGGIVLMAGTATPLDSVLVEQVVGAAREAGGDSASLAESRQLVERLSRAVREGEDLEGSGLPPTLDQLGHPRWLREHMEHDPLATIRKVRVPVLIANGGQDVQVAPEHARRLGAALAETAHPDYEVKIFPGLNHLFAVSRGEGTAEYADPEAKVDVEFLGYLTDWLAVRLIATN